MIIGHILGFINKFAPSAEPKEVGLPTFYTFNAPNARYFKINVYFCSVKYKYATHSTIESKTLKEI